MEVYEEREDFLKKHDSVDGSGVLLEILAKNVALKSRFPDIELVAGNQFDVYKKFMRRGSLQMEDKLSLYSNHGLEVRTDEDGDPDYVVLGGLELYKQSKPSTSDGVAEIIEVDLARESSLEAEKMRKSPKKERKVKRIRKPGLVHFMTASTPVRQLSELYAKKMAAQKGKNK
ncbi:hypothetical protein HDE_13727 [Halotydeus destructor]|nr:hypothetical protein HDE_13727 [Halotydeus destructor]